MNGIVWLWIAHDGVYSVGYVDENGVWQHDDDYHSELVAEARVLFLNAGRS